MTKEDKLKIGLAINSIAIMLDLDSYDKVKGRLQEIEDIIAKYPDIEEDDGK